MKKIILVLVLMLTACKPEVDILEAPFEMSELPEITEYFINASLDDDLDVLSVNQVISYYNDKADFDELYINAYPAELGMSEFSISLFEIEGVEHSFVRDGSVIHVELEETLFEGEHIEISINYSFKYWNQDRLAKYGSDYITMFFYPYVAYYDSEWNTDRYAFNGEAYFNDVGNYYVNLQIPDKYVLATGGTVLDTSNVKGGKVYSIELLNARDYSFSVSPNYREYYKELEGVDVFIKSIRELGPDEEQLLFDITEKAIIFTEDSIGEYPYETLTIELGHIYGMESASIIYCSEDIQIITVVHEIYHQWFYGIIGNDQGSMPFLDEGLTSFVTGLFFSEHPEYMGEGYWNWYSTQNPRYDDRRTSMEGRSALLTVHDYSNDYGFLVYVYSAELMKYYMDEALNGSNELFLEALSEYYNTYKYEEATLDDFLTILEDITEVSGTKNWFYEYLGAYQELGGLE